MDGTVFEGESIAMLACSDCGGEQPHRVRYYNDVVVEMSCTKCGRTIALPRGMGESGIASETGSRADGDKQHRLGAALSTRAPRVARTLGAVALGLSFRAATKPIRMWRQVRHEGASALKSMPGRAATKPLRLARELQQDVGSKVRELL